MWSKWEPTKGWPENERGHFSRASFFITYVRVVEGLFLILGAGEIFFGAPIFVIRVSNKCH